MKVENCPKNLKACTPACPDYECWAYEQHLQDQKNAEKERDQGWE